MSGTFSFYGGRAMSGEARPLTGRLTGFDYSRVVAGVRLLEFRVAEDPGRTASIGTEWILVPAESDLRVVSLDAAIEAAAKADCESTAGFAETWETCPNQDRHRENVRPLVTAAVMGGAQ